MSHQTVSIKLLYLEEFENNTLQVRFVAKPAKIIVPETPPNSRNSIGRIAPKVSVSATSASFDIECYSDRRQN